MKWIEAKVVFNHSDNDLAADLIADIFYGFDLQGVVIEDPYIEAGDDWAEDAIGRPNSHSVIGYFPKGRQAEENCRVLTHKLEELQSNLGLFYRISYKELDEENWAEAWKAFFWPQKIGRQIVVKPTWWDYHAKPDDIVVELDPGMAFGTGTHPTTALCIEMMETYFKDGDTFLDVGTGSGILMIAAAKLGAGAVCGVDRDEIAVKIAIKNLMLNKIDRNYFSVHTGNLLEGIERKYDFIAANILTHVILDLLDDIKQVIKKKGIFVCSGILEDNADLVAAKMKKIGFDILESRTREQWVAICGRFKV
ncbi:MAG: 50S ribosomal protein L11 methyltransferase [Desulfobacterales bacterium]|nr:MAG: 50S ribosomal protein L11 methyltransferase [Desulfobacterales bacterium]